jgi:hypothetical protein
MMSAMEQTPGILANSDLKLIRREWQAWLEALQSHGHSPIESTT